MSGALVGEVIAASSMLQKRGVSQRGFTALIAIAEKCHPKTRRGSVRWNHIRDALYGASHRTAQRAVQDLQAAGVLEVLKPGFGNQYGRTCAPVYRIAPLVDDDTWVAQSTNEDDDTQMSQSTEVDDDKSEVDDDKSGSGSRHPGVVLDGPIDVPIDVKECVRGTRLPDGWQPTPEVVAQMRSECPHIDIDFETRKFRDHWHDQPGAKGRKVTWTGTWRNWIRNARPSNNGGPRPSTSDTQAAQTQALKNQPATTRLELEK